MKYLLDTDTCIYFLNGNQNIANKIANQNDSDVCVTIFNIAELMFGAYNSKKVNHNLKRVTEFKNRIIVLNSVNDSIVKLFAYEKAVLRKRGMIIGDIDLFIAAFAIFYNLILVTNNYSHFKHISTLKIENWI